MSLTDRDRKIIFILVPLALVLGYWFLLLSPKRAEESKVHTALQSAQGGGVEALVRSNALRCRRYSYPQENRLDERVAPLLGCRQARQVRVDPGAAREPAQAQPAHLIVTTKAP